MSRLAWRLGTRRVRRHAECIVPGLFAKEGGADGQSRAGRLAQAVGSGERRTVVEPTWELDVWAQENFGGCELGDERRTARVVKLAQQMAEHPDGSTPDQTEHWADLKAAYRLIDREEVTFAAVASPHWELTRRRARGTVLVIGDTTELDFGWDRQASGLGPVGNGSGRGFLLHNALAVDAATSEILGLAGQEVLYRRPKPQGENSYRRTQREGKESEVWARLIARIGRPAEGVTYVHVFDRGADNLDVFCQLRQARGEWVIRASHLHRVVDELTADGPRPRCALQTVLDRQPVLGTYELSVRATKEQPARMAKLAVRVAKVFVPPRSKRRTALQRKLQFAGLEQWVVEAREIDPPKGVMPVHWVLWSSRPVETFDDAWQILTDYERRWLIEEFHKALKTGCRVEARQHQTAKRLEVMTGLCSVIAVRLVQLKTLARTAPQTPAERGVPRVWLDMLRALRKTSIVSVRDFYRHLAGLGGFLMRKGDGEPGWITLWRGTEKLRAAIRGYFSMKKKWFIKVL